MPEPVRDIRVGDKITVTTTSTVNEVFGPDKSYGYVQLDNGQAFNNGALDSDVLQWTRVSRPKAKTGDTVTGKDLVGTMWKRGTMIGSALFGGPGRPEYVLRGDGKWAHLGGTNTGVAYAFSDFDFPEASWKIHYTPDSK